MKQVVKQYGFNASQKQVTVQNQALSLDQFLLVANATRNQIIYNFAEAGLGGAVSTSGGNTVLALQFNTAEAGHADSDKLIVYYDDRLDAGGISESLVSQVGTAAFVQSGVGAGVPVKVLDQNLQRKYLLLKNESDANIFVVFYRTGVVSDAPRMKLEAGASIVFEGKFVPTNEIYLYGSKAGQGYFIAHG